MSQDSEKISVKTMTAAEMGEIASELAPVSPSEDRASAIKARVMKGILAADDGSTSKDLEAKFDAQTVSSSEFTTISVAARNWSSYSPGVDICTLYDDGQRRSALLRMSAGSFLFPHKHEQIEESIVLEGSAIIGDHTEILAGDYQFSASGSEHPIISSPEGCIVLVHGESKPKIRITLGLIGRLTKYFLNRPEP